MPCRTCDRPLGEVRAVKQRWVAVCPGCADRTELRCPSCRRALEDARDRPALEAFCVDCERPARIVDGEITLGEPRVAVAASVPGTSSAGSIREVGERTGMRSVGRSLRVGRGKTRVRDAAFRASSRTRDLELLRTARPTRESPRQVLATMTLAGVSMALLLMLAYLVGFGPRGPSYATAPIAMAMAITLAFVVAGAVAAMLAGRREDSRARRGLYRATRVTVSDEGLQVDGAPAIAATQVKRLRVATEDGDHAVRIQLADDEERLLLAGLEAEEAELVVREVRAALDDFDPR